MTTTQFRQIMMILWLVALLCSDNIFMASIAMFFLLVYGIGSIMAARKKQ